MKLVFMGTPEFADSALRTLISSRHEVAAVFTRADAEKGRGHRLVPPPVKVTAVENSIPVYQPNTLRDGEAERILREISPDCIVVAAYGRILPHEIITLPKYGCINLHGSLLPRLRGAAPIQRAILEGEKTTGITVMRMDDGLDTGDMILKEGFEIGETYYPEVLEKLSEISSRLIIKALDTIEDGTAVYEKQDDSLSTYADKITKEDYALDPSLPAGVLLRRIRALWPEAFITLPSGRFKITKAVVSPEKYGGTPGAVAALSAKGDGWADVVCGDGTALRVLKLIPEGKGEQTAGDAARGRRLAVSGDVR